MRAAKCLREEQVEDNDSGLRRQVATQQQDQEESCKKVLMEAARLEQGVVAVERAEAANRFVEGWRLPERCRRACCARRDPA